MRDTPHHFIDNAGIAVDQGVAQGDSARKIGNAGGDGRGCFRQAAQGLTDDLEVSLNGGRNIGSAR